MQVKIVFHPDEATGVTLTCSKVHHLFRVQLRQLRAQSSPLLLLLQSLGPAAATPPAWAAASSWWE